jgi:glutamine amidotransferase
MITIIDYGLGNIRAFANVYNRLNIKTMIAHKPEDIREATKLILPGVGSFDYAMSQFNNSGMREETERKVFEENTPIVGICVGMQMLGKYSDEGKLPGLGWIDGYVKLFDISKIPYKTRMPHMGWNTIYPTVNNNLLNGFNDTSRFYFLHSYYFICNREEDIIAKTDYGINYASAINKDNIYGIQFHPEKSHTNGVQLLNNFANL